MLRFVPLALLLATPAFAQGPSDADLLAEQVRRLGSNPQDLDALLSAGELSVRLEDISAAAAFFARAEKIDARNARAKAGEAALLVHSERPAEALRLFAQAEQLGLPAARFAGERGLAYDLLGDPVRAQRDYQTALTAGENGEVRRRYALSLAIAGRQAQSLSTLDPLIRANDRAAWRARAFVLAMGGDVAGATRIAETMMPPGAATALGGFFIQLPRLAAADKAFAVHFGEVQASPQRLADARLPHDAPLPVPPLVVATAPAAAPAADRRGKRDRKRRGETQVAVALPPAPAPLPPPPAYQAPSYQTPAAATPVRVDRPLGAGEQTALAAGGNRVRPGRGPSTAIGPSYAAPAVTRPLTPEEQRSLAAVAGSRDGTTSHRPDTPRAAPVAVASRPAVSPPATVASATPVRAAATVAVPPAAALPTSTPAAAPAPVTRPLSPEEQVSLAAAAGSPSPAAGPPEPAPTPGFSAASGVAVASLSPSITPVPAAITPPPVAASSVRPAPLAVTPPAMVAIPAVPPRPRPSRRQQYAQTDSVLARIVAGLSVPAAELDVAPAAAPSAAERRAAERKAAAAAKALADKKAAAAAKAEADRQAAEERRLARTQPARIWVQVGGGANEAALGLSWRTIKAKAPQAFAGRQGWTTPLRATNRILAGPFKTDAEARAFVNQLAKAGVQAFAFTSDAGQKVTRLESE